jgi:uncharacterized OB-fold protein
MAYELLPGQNMPVPIVDSDSAPFWEYANARELRVQRCSACGELRYPPRPMCPGCGSLDSTWERLSGLGNVYSWVVAYHPVHKLVVDKVPYTILLVQLDEGPRMVSRLVGPAPGTIREGLRLEVVFEPIADGFLVPHFRVAADRR